MIPPACPRCGYDQSGEIARWHAECPLRGICSECGVDFAWKDILSPDRSLCPGFFEHATTIRTCFSWAWRTLTWAVLPWRFWSRVGMHHQVRPRRMFLWFAYLWLSILWILAPAFGVCVVTARASMFHNVGVRWFASLQSPWPKTPLRWWWQEVEAQDLICLFHPFVGIVNIPQTDSFGTVIGYEPVVDCPIAHVPFPVWLPLVAVLLGLPAMIMVLPQTRAQAKLRGVHVLRATAFSLAFLSVPMLLLVVDALRKAAYFMGLGPPVRWGEDWCDLFIDRWSWTFLVWLAIWWYFAVHRGFRIKQAPLVWFAMLVPTLLLAYAASIVAELCS